ncbi:MAG: elongation factor G [Myxococcota bacterium]|nr:elongation factor G [Myxococcota bacterium]
MPKDTINDVRNIGIAAHIDAGKTTLTERVLFYTGASHKIGEVHDGQATMDYMAEEQAHGITITSAVTQCPWKDHIIQIVDTPGHVDFTIEVERAMRVLDGAIIVLDAVSGVEPQTETVWRQANRFDIPRVIFINKMDRPGADYARSMDTVAKRLGGNPIPICVPTDDHTVVDLVNGCVYAFSGDRGETVTTLPLTDELRAATEEHRETMLLSAAEYDPSLEDIVLEGGDADPAQVWAALRVGTIAGEIHPCFSGSALRNWGVQPVLDGVLALLPAPKDRPPTNGIDIKNDSTERIEMEDRGALAALAFKVQLWDGRRHVFARIYRGTLSAGEKIRIAGTGTDERVARIFDVNAGSKRRIETARAGQIVLLAGLKHATTGDTLCRADHEVLLARIESRDPVLGLAIEPESSRDEDKLVEVIDKVCEEDPTLKFHEDEETGQRILSGMGELHLMIVFERIEREFGLKVRAGKPRVVSRETILSPGHADSLLDRMIRLSADETTNLKARVVARCTPLERGSDVTTSMADLRVLPEGSELNRAQLEAVELGLADGVSAGPIEGSALQDVSVSLETVELFGDQSTAQALRIAVAQAVRQAIRDGDAAIMRPLMKVAVVVPNEQMGGVLGDLQARHAIISGTVQDENVATIHGECALEQLLGYTTDLRSMTQGRGQFTMEFARFDVG